MVVLDQKGENARQKDNRFLAGLLFNWIHSEKVGPSIIRHDVLGLRRLQELARILYRYVHGTEEPSEAEADEFRAAIRRSLIQMLGHEIVLNKGIAFELRRQRDQARKGFHPSSAKELREQLLALRQELMREEGLDENLDRPNNSRTDA